MNTSMHLHKHVSTYAYMLVYCIIRICMHVRTCTNLHIHMYRCTYIDIHLMDLLLESGHDGPVPLISVADTSGSYATECGTKR